MQQFLVTGASGFIGRALCTDLQQRGHRVRALLREPTQGPWDETACVDLETAAPPPSLMQDIDGVFHCAGIAHVTRPGAGHARRLWRVNVEATRELVQLASRHRVPRFVFLSSVQAAGNPGARRADEHWDAPPDDPYGQSKRAAEEALFAVRDQSDMACIALRPALVYGPGVKGNLQRLLRAAAHRRLPPLPDSGNRRSLTGLDALVEAAVLVMGDPRASGVYIVADHRCYSTHQLCLALYQALNRRPPRPAPPLALFRLAAHLGDAAGAIGRRNMPWNSAAYQRLFGSACFVPARLQGELGWRRDTSFEAALPAMLRALDGTRPGPVAGA